ncbi:hypothetical protein JL09_g2287 [Pichia kudriavzevii]|uniref:glucan endo-1,3-beta-D-glucosidase n=1 Tax=Pichia kudriavzevii TaxID=4909 RepID=A0A099P2P8_PICKU|nr:hypothetical protein JL09_g2287 [Pichia kudriavzevii]
MEIPPPIPPRDYASKNSPIPLPPRDYLQKADNVPEQPPRSHPGAQQKSIQVQTQGYSSSDGLANIFDYPISTDPPLSSFQTSNQHPVKLPQFYDVPGPLQTNNFYGNFLVDDQNLPVWTHPYSIWKSTDDQFKGLGISHTSASQRVFGDDPDTGNLKYFFNPVGICSMMLSANEFEPQNFNFKVGDLSRFSIGLKFLTGTGEMHVNAVQGMGMITAVYNGSITPRVASKVGIQPIQQLGTTSNGLQKYKFVLFDNTSWIVYTNSILKQVSQNSVVSSPTNGQQVIVQIAKLSDDNSIQYYDKVAGSWVTGCILEASVISNNRCQYTFDYSISGSSASNKILQWFLPHHIDSIDPKMQDDKAGDISLDSTCKGPMEGFIISQFTMVESLPPESLMFEPWSDKSGVHGYSKYSLDIINKVAEEEISLFDVVNESNTDSMYATGKVFDKGAFLLYVVSFVLKNQNLTKIMLDKMKTAFDKFINNRQLAPLCYDNQWKGIVSTSGLQEGNFYCDYGNCFYNDHHFHYGYHVHAAAIVALVDHSFGDGSWINGSKDWVENLIRDFCNPSPKDKYFPQFRSFDFFNGHSFANGLFAHGDGKDEESSSEDFHAYYGIRLWSAITGNKSLEAVSSLILAIEKRAIGMYMYYKDDNKIMPPRFIKNRVSGILFENKIDHATYFGMEKEYIHGIHMIPLTPMSNYIRDSRFVKEEWEGLQLAKLADAIDSGWKGLLMLNCAMYDPKRSWEFFSSKKFQSRWLDNGMSRTWALAYAAGMGGC